MTDLFELARDCLAACDSADKVSRTLAAAALVHDGSYRLDAGAPAVAVVTPGRPDKPSLVHHSGLPGRKLGSEAGRKAFIHALAHIEFNAINLAWDAVLRFRGLPDAYYADWVKVAGEEALHFRMLNDRLNELGSEYGDYPAHDGLWEMAAKTADDVLDRMALVPRVLEARGLDVTPAMINRLQKCGDNKTAALLQRIYTDEIGHVETGSRWFRYVCRQRGLEPATKFRAILVEYKMDRIKRPLNGAARAQAGFDSNELCMLEEMAAGEAQ